MTSPYQQNYKQVHASTMKNSQKTVLALQQSSTASAYLRPEFKLSGGSFFGIGKTSDLWFTIKGLSENTVKRSDKDFDWLRKTLVSLFPGQFVIFLFIQIPPYSRI